MFPSLKKLTISLCQVGLLLSCMPAQSADLLPLAKDIKPNTNNLPPAFVKPLKVSVCFFDIQGSSGEFYGRAKDIGLIAQRWNIKTDFKVFTDEALATESFKAGKCDAAVITTLRARQFNKFMGSVNAIGGAPTYEHMRVLLKSLFDAKLEKFAITEPYQVVGVFPVGAEYLHVRDQAMNSVEALAGKKVSVMDSDPSEVVMMQTMGLQATGASIANFVRPFNSGEVDALVAPAMVYAPYEVQRGLGDKGGIYRTPVTQMVASLIINRESLKKKTTDLDSRVAAFHAITAEFLDQLLDRNLVTIERTEKEIPKKYWMTLEPENEKKFQEALRTTRMQMTKDGVYDARMMKLLKKVRCKIEPTAAECALTDE